MFAPIQCDCFNLHADSTHNSFRGRARETDSKTIVESAGYRFEFTLALIASSTSLIPLTTYLLKAMAEREEVEDS